MKNIVTCVTRCKTICNNFLLEAEISQGYSLVNLSCSAAVVRCSFFMRYPIEEETDLDKNAGVLFGRCYLFLHL